ncbi:MAG: phosphogluconate dehydratase [Deltaproteobacteria bacterium]|nr:phosphogluconate dehydratase [Deltaproteobacteria bacterium]
MNRIVLEVTDRIRSRSRASREGYLQRITEAKRNRPARHFLPCSNLAHGLAVCGPKENQAMRHGSGPNIAIITSYNDMLSAHKPYETYPRVLKDSVARAGGTAQVAGAVPAMCDGITQGEAGMDLSLISRDVIAMSVVIALSHNLFDGGLLLGICDKIMPGLLMGALQFGHLPMILVPAGPMPTGIGNREKARARERFTQGEISRDDMLEVECRSYHCAGTCTFYGTANSNQLLAEVMGLHLPGASFVNPGTPWREAFNREAARQVVGQTSLGPNYTPLGHVVSEKALVNGIVALLATGGSTNQTMHLVAIARAAGIRINWDDFSDLSEVVPLIARIYPNGPEDINGFQQAGGMAVLIGELLSGGYLHEDVQTVAGKGLERYTRSPELHGDAISYRDEPARSLNREVIAAITTPFETSGGLKVVAGNLGRAVIKTAPLADGARTVVEAEAMVFDDQAELEKAFHAGELDRDVVAVVRFQGPQAIGMPELHKLITPLGILMNRGFKVALVTDGRLSGASGKVPAAIHVTPEAFCGGLLAKVRNGDMIRIDAGKSILELKVSKEELDKREYAEASLRPHRSGLGRQIFAALRRDMMGAEEGASSLFTYVQERCHVSFDRE